MTELLIFFQIVFKMSLGIVVLYCTFRCGYESGRHHGVKDVIELFEGDKGEE